LRERLKLNYEWWLLSHILLGVTAVVFAQLHASMAGLYINTAWKQAVWIVMAAVTVGLVSYLRLLKPALQRSARFRVVEVLPERGETHTLVIEPVGHPGFRFQPGQFAWIKLAGSPFTMEEHPFSFSSSALRPDRLEFGIKAVGDFTRSIAEVPVGTRAYLDGPHGAFSIDRYPAPGYLLFAGGSGITPFMSILRTMADRGDPRPVLLVYAGASWESLAYREELERLKGRMDLELVVVLEHPEEGWEGESGFVSAELLERRLPREHLERVCFLCGPPPMMDAVRDALLERGVPMERIQLERFALV
jgi:predicted ferric reductase